VLADADASWFKWPPAGDALLAESDGVPYALQMTIAGGHRARESP